MLWLMVPGWLYVSNLFKPTLETPIYKLLRILVNCVLLGLVFSLENIFKELSTDIDGFVHPGHGDLSGWARQGNQAWLGLFENNAMLP